PASKLGNSAAVDRVLPTTTGATKSETICQAVPVVSELYEGVSVVVISPHPLTPSAITSTRRMRRSCVTPKLVSNGAFRRIRISRRVRFSIFITSRLDAPNPGGVGQAIFQKQNTTFRTARKPCQAKMHQMVIVIDMVHHSV